MKDYECKQIMGIMRRQLHELGVQLIALEQDLRFLKNEMQQCEINLSDELKRFCHEFGVEDDNERLNDSCYVYFIVSDEMNIVKIGISNNPESRLKTLSTAHGYPLRIHHTIKCKNKKEAFDVEHWLHAYYAEYQKRPFGQINGRNGQEWFSDEIIKGDRFHKPIGYFENTGKIKEV